jgi:hypothetical protein
MITAIGDRPNHAALIRSLPRSANSQSGSFRCRFDDPRVEEVRAELAGLDGLLIWVNPIQDGVDRSNVDRVAREASARGLFVFADPAVIMKMGTK